MKNLKQFIKESLDPRGSFMVKKNMPTQGLWEYYECVNNDPNNEMAAAVEESEFENFLEYAKKNRWKTDSNGYYIIPKGTKLEFDSYLKCMSHIGKFEINGAGVYVTFMYDELDYGDLDEYLKEI